MCSPRPPESVVKALSRTNGKADRALIRRSVRLMNKAIRVVKRALPNTDPELIGGFFASLFDLWESGQTLDEKIKEISGFRFPRDRERLYTTLIWINAIQVDIASYWIPEVEKDLPKLLRALDSPERKTRPGKQKLAGRRSVVKRGNPLPK